MRRGGSTEGSPGWWSRLVPRVPERISGDFYRMTGKLRVVTAIVLAVVSIAGTATADLPGLDLDAFWRYQVWILSVAAVDVALSVWLWKGRVSIEGMDRLTLACGVLDATTLLISVHLLGSANSHMIAMMAAMIMFYRLAFRFRTAAAIAGFALVAHWTMAALELAGVVAPQPIALNGEVDAVYRVRDAQLGAMWMISASYALTFLLAHWAVVRLRHSERAVRVLREALHGGAAGPVGRHSGRALRDTYEVGALLAAGGMGEVYRGYHRRTGRAVAIKLLHPHLADAPDVLHRFQREAEIAGKLGSPHIVQVLDVDRDGEQPFLVLELLEGEDLGARLARGTLAPTMVAELVAQVADGLHAARDAGVVHRDLKPENLFLVDRGGEAPLLKILDFGISKIQGAATRLTNEVALLGTPDYMAPEQAEGRTDDIDHRSDVFALGAIVHHALTGRRPFAGPSIPAVLRAICDHEPMTVTAIRGGVPADVDAVLRIAMAKRADERYQDARELAADLRAAVAGELSEPVRRRAAAVTRSSEHPLVDAAAVAAAATLDAAIGVAKTAGPSDP